MESLNLLPFIKVEKKDMFNSVYHKKPKFKKVSKLSSALFLSLSD